MDPSTELDLLTGPVTLAPNAGPESSLVFVGFQLTWKKRVADLVMNTRFAEAWETAFTHWQIDGRNVHLCDATKGYTVDLTDGSAAFMVSRPNGMLRLAESHIAQYCQALVEGGRKEVELFCEVQYLSPVEEDFLAHVRFAGDRLIKRDVLAALNPEMSDFAYYVDFTHEGQWFQVKIGVLRRDEVPFRVISARYIKPLPAVARFQSVTSKTAVAEGFSHGEFLDRVFRVGKTIAQELLST
jgi:hypothetical protein